MPTRTFVVIPLHGSPPATAENSGFLVRDRWDDFGFGTTFYLYMSDQTGAVLPVGQVKIATEGMFSNGADAATVYVELPEEFERLQPSCFSLGQDPTYYENLVMILGVEQTAETLRALGDLAIDSERFDAVMGEPSVQSSLLRTVKVGTVKDQYRRILEGGDTKAGFTMTYRFPVDESGETKDMAFDVVPDSFPPSNVHVLIGSNGAGKTRTLRSMRELFNEPDALSSPSSPLHLTDRTQITGVVSVSFSAFDVFDQASFRQADSGQFRVVNVGLRRADGNPAPMDPTALEDSFESVVRLCLGDRRLRLQQVLSFLSADLTLGRSEIGNPDGLLERLDFGHLSSGHKIVLLTLVSLVAYVDEKTLVLIDEPESHLHPPLLAAFTRALSWLLTDRNGIAVVATHSPVVLQEVPKKCAWIVWSAGDTADIKRPDIETFGENLGLLTREVFSLEIEESGYHRMLAEVAEQEGTFEAALERFDGELGEEAKSLLRVMINRRLRQVSVD